MAKENTCCFTGHRILGNDFNVDVLKRGIEYLIGLGVDTFICGGATGFDTLCAKEVLNAKQTHPHIKLHIYAPCNNQSEKWKLGDKLAYSEILKKADFVDMPPVTYFNGCMKIRNHKMVDASAYCICYLNGMRSGTGQTYRYANQQGLSVFNIAGKD
ncbi:MAG: DUF1273 domain-containing protein [Ruminococcaceae bacterium]|nr:DUF1273 domain-containing protein [Oscillospiraceae bacterium]